MIFFLENNPQGRQIFQAKTASFVEYQLIYIRCGRFATGPLRVLCNPKSEDDLRRIIFSVSQITMNG
jgi:hypothetical protein